MTRYLAGRLLQIIVVLFVMSFVIYGLIGLILILSANLISRRTVGASLW